MDKRAQKYVNRRKRLRLLIQEKARGNQAEFARMYGYDRSQIGQYLSETYQDGRTLGEGAIEKLEDRTGVSIGWFDQTEDGVDSKLADDEKALLEAFRSLGPTERRYLLEDAKKYQVRNGKKG